MSSKIRWKVVTEERLSCRVNEPEYLLKYVKGSIVTAVSYTFGIFCFKTKRAAEYFKSTYENERKLIIIKVRPLCKGGNPKVVFWCRSLKSDYEDFLKDPSSGNATVYNKDRIPKDTICYKSVEVLD